MIQRSIRKFLGNGREAYRQGKSDLVGLDEEELIKQFGMMLEALKQRNLLHPMLVAEMEWIRNHESKEEDAERETSENPETVDHHWV